MQRDEIITLLCCPDCGNALSFNENECMCLNCQRVFICENDIPILLPEGSSEIETGGPEDSSRLGKDWTGENQLQTGRHRYSYLTKKYNKEYFLSYTQKNFLGKPRGERSFVYDYWIKYLSHRVRSRANVLEIGCGLGYFAKRLDSTYTVFAMDISIEALRFARDRVCNGLVFQADARKIPLRDASMDCIVAFDLIEHLPTPETFLQQLKRVLTNDGIFVLATPNPESLGAVVKDKRTYLHDKPWEERLSVWHGWRDDTHINIRRTEEWKKLVSTMGFHVIREGTDFCWDTPYFSFLPLILQKIVFNGSNRLLTYLFGILPWKRGENYYLVAQNQKQQVNEQFRG